MFFLFRFCFLRVLLFFILLSNYDLNSNWILQAFHVLYHSDNNVLLGAPTGSGKTISAELAMFRLFNTQPDMKVSLILRLVFLIIHCLTYHILTGNLHCTSEGYCSRKNEWLEKAASFSAWQKDGMLCTCTNKQNEFELYAK